MAKELYFREEQCKHLEFRKNLPIETVIEIGKISLQIINSNQQISPKILHNGAKRLGVKFDDMENGLYSMASLFLKASFLARSLHQTTQHFEMLGIPYAGALANLWYSEFPNIRKYFCSLKLRQVELRERHLNLGRTIFLCQIDA